MHNVPPLHAFKHTHFVADAAQHELITSFHHPLLMTRRGIKRPFKRHRICNHIYNLKGLNEGLCIYEMMLRVLSSNHDISSLTYDSMSYAVNGMNA